METISHRKNIQMDIEKFENDTEQSCFYTMTELTCNEDTYDIRTMAAQYNSMLRKIVDDHAPPQTKTMKIMPPISWYDDEIKGIKRDRRNAERRWL